MRKLLAIIVALVTGSISVAVGFLPQTVEATRIAN